MNHVKLVSILAITRIKAMSRVVIMKLPTKEMSNANANN